MVYVRACGKTTESISLEAHMTNRERFMGTLNFQMPDDRLPLLEWASWWDKTLTRWQGEGLPAELDGDSIHTFFQLDPQRQFWISPRGSGFPAMAHGQGPVTDRASYVALKPFLYPTDAVLNIRDRLQALKGSQERGEVVVWLTLEGFFWFPRTLFGIENHLYAFFDEPELMEEMNRDLTAFHLKVLSEIREILTPDFMTFAEDMSYNNGPMLSKAQFDAFLLPYYRQVIPVLSEMGTLPLVDTDGKVDPMIPWLQEAGIRGVLPLERQSGVDVARIRANHPDFRLVGGFDKTVMHLGETAMRTEFERLLPVMRQGGFIPSVDHQTPPAVSLADYRLYRRLMEEYCAKACAGDDADRAE